MQRLHLQVILCLESAILLPLNYIRATGAHKPRQNGEPRQPRHLDTSTASTPTSTPRRHPHMESALTDLDRPRHKPRHRLDRGSTASTPRQPGLCTIRAATGQSYMNAGTAQAATSGRVALEASNPSRANFPLCGHCTLAHGSAPECGCYGWPAGGASRARARLHDDERSTRCVSRTRYMPPSAPTLSSKLSLRAHICIAALMLVSVMYVR